MKDKTVLVGLSGGVDSAMAALLLLKQGYRVIGVTMSIWDSSIPISESTKSGCFGPGEAEDIAAAAALSKKLGIEHHVITLKDEYKENVLSYFCSTYAEGKTPNPCLMCNQRMKFGLLPAKAKEAGIEFDYFATGHYVRISYDAASSRWQLFRAKDRGKDQSYFLSFLAQEQLKNLIFPLGEMTKQEIKNFARENGFSELAEKNESQDFLESDDMSVHFDPATIKEGEIVDVNGKVLGKHRGIINYTIGQRRNLGVAGFAEPHYVIAIEGAKNRIVLGTKEHLFKTKCRATGVNWLSIAPIEKEIQATAKIRLQHEAAACKAKICEDGSLMVEFAEPQMSITPGQGIVFYSDDLVLAGGIIDTIA